MYKRRKSQILKLEQQKLLQVQLQQHLKIKKDKKKKGGKSISKRHFHHNKRSSSSKKNIINKGIQSAPFPIRQHSQSLSDSRSIVEHQYVRGQISNNQPLWLVAKAQSEKRFEDIDDDDDDIDDDNENDPDIDDDMQFIDIDNDREIIEDMDQDINIIDNPIIVQEVTDDDIIVNVNKSGYISLLNKDEDDIFDQNPSIGDEHKINDNIVINNVAESITNSSSFDVSRNSKLQQRKPKNLTVTITNYDK